MDNTIIGGLLGIVAALLAGFFGIYLPRRNARRDSGRQLIAEFAVVEVAFNKIASSNCHAIDPVLREAFQGLEEKINIFKRHLFWPWEKRGFSKAWVAYYNAYGDTRCECYHHYMAYGSNPNYKENFRKNVDRLLKYAKQK